MQNGACLAAPPPDCQPTSYFDSNVRRCVSCPENCLTCFRTLCYSCDSSSYLDNGLCHPHCQTPEKVEDLAANTCLWADPLCSAYSLDTKKCT